jgi:type VI secretion system protein ImpF
MAISNRFRRSLLDRLITNAEEDTLGLTLTYTLEQLRQSVARDVEALLNSRTAVDFDDLSHLPNVQRSVMCFGIRDFVGRVLTSSEDQRYIAASLSRALTSFEPRLRNVDIEFKKNANSLNSLAFTIRAILMAYPSAEPVAFDAILQPSLSRFSVAPSRLAA